MSNAQGVSQKVAVADPDEPTHVVKPNADGSLNVDVVGGSGTTVTATAAAPAYVEGSTQNPVSSDLHGSLRILILDSAGNAVSWTDPVGVEGQTASGAPLTVDPVTIGARAATASPSAVDNGDVVNAQVDVYGRLVSISELRELRANAYISLTDTNTTAITASEASTAHDLYGLILANTGADVVDVLIENGSTDILTLTIPADDTRGFMLSADAGYKGASATGWNGTKSTGTGPVRVSALYTKRPG